MKKHILTIIVMTFCLAAFISFGTMTVSAADDCFDKCEETLQECLKACQDDQGCQDKCNEEYEKCMEACEEEGPSMPHY